MDARKRVGEPIAATDLASLERELQEYNCLEEFRSLIDAGCSPEWLMHARCTLRLAFAHHSRLQDAPGRLDSRKLRTLVERTRWVALAWEQQFLTEFGKEVLKLAAKTDPFRGKEEFLNIPQRLLSLARWASDVSRKTKRRHRPLYDDALAELTEYVKLKTADYHDREVSALVGFAIGAEVYEENTLPVWRSEHQTAVSRARRRIK